VHHGRPMHQEIEDAIDALERLMEKQTEDARAAAREAVMKVAENDAHKAQLRFVAVMQFRGLYPRMPMPSPDPLRGWIAAWQGGACPTP